MPGPFSLCLHAPTAKVQARALEVLSDLLQELPRTLCEQLLQNAPILLFYGYERPLLEKVLQLMDPLVEAGVRLQLIQTPPRDQVNVLDWPPAKPPKILRDANGLLKTAPVLEASLSAVAVEEIPPISPVALQQEEEAALIDASELEVTEEDDLEEPGALIATDDQDAEAVEEPGQIIEEPLAPGEGDDIPDAILDDDLADDPVLLETEALLSKAQKSRTENVTETTPEEPLAAAPEELPEPAEEALTVAPEEVAEEPLQEAPAEMLEAVAEAAPLAEESEPLLEPEAELVPEEPLVAAPEEAMEEPVQEAPQEILEAVAEDAPLMAAPEELPEPAPEILQVEASETLLEPVAELEPEAELQPEPDLAPEAELEPEAELLPEAPQQDLSKEETTKLEPPEEDIVEPPAEIPQEELLTSSDDIVIASEDAVETSSEASRMAPTRPVHELLAEPASAASEQIVLPGEDPAGPAMLTPEPAPRSRLPIGLERRSVIPTHKEVAHVAVSSDPFESTQSMTPVCGSGDTKDGGLVQDGILLSDDEPDDLNVLTPETAVAPAPELALAPEESELALAEETPEALLDDEPLQEEIMPADEVLSPEPEPEPLHEEIAETSVLATEAMYQEDEIGVVPDVVSAEPLAEVSSEEILLSEPEPQSNLLSEEAPLEDEDLLSEPSEEILETEQSEALTPEEEPLPVEASSTMDSVPEEERLPFLNNERVAPGETQVSLQPWEMAVEKETVDDLGVAEEETLLPTSSADELGFDDTEEEELSGSMPSIAATTAASVQSQAKDEPEEKQLSLPSQWTSESALEEKVVYPAKVSYDAPSLEDELEVPEPVVAEMPVKLVPPPQPAPVKMAPPPVVEMAAPIRMARPLVLPPPLPVVAAVRPASLPPVASSSETTLRRGAVLRPATRDWEREPVYLMDMSTRRDQEHPPLDEEPCPVPLPTAKRKNPAASLLQKKKKPVVITPDDDALTVILSQNLSELEGQEGRG